MNKIILLFPVFFIYLSGYSQKNFSAEILTGIGLNEDISLINENIEDLNVFSIQLNANYTFKLYKAFFAETGLGAQWYFGSGNIAISEFESTKLRLNIPFVIGYPMLKKISVGTGVVITHNKDFDDISFRESNSLRTSLIIKGSYELKQGFSILLLLKQNLSNTPDAFLVGQPNTDIAFGISYKLF